MLERIFPTGTEIEVPTGTMVLGTRLTIAREAEEYRVICRAMSQGLEVPINLIQISNYLMIPALHLWKCLRHSETEEIRIGLLELTNVEGYTIDFITVETAQDVCVGEDLHLQRVSFSPDWFDCLGGLMLMAEVLIDSWAILPF